MSNPPEADAGSDPARHQPGKPRPGFTPAEIKAFRLYAVVVAAIAAGMFTVAPKGLGQVLGVLFAVALLPVPPAVILYLRRRKGGG